MILERQAASKPYCTPTVSGRRQVRFLPQCGQCSLQPFATGFKLVRTLAGSDRILCMQLLDFLAISMNLAMHSDKIVKARELAITLAATPVEP